MAAKRPSNPGLMTSPLWGLSFPICEMGVIIQPDRELCKRPSWKPLEASALPGVVTGCSLLLEAGTQSPWTKRSTYLRRGCLSSSGGWGRWMDSNGLVGSP